MTVERINPRGVGAPPRRGYSHVVKAGNTVYVAGQVARDVNGNTVPYAASVCWKTAPRAP